MKKKILFPLVALLIGFSTHAAPPLNTVKNFDKLFSSTEWRHRLDPCIGAIILTQKQALIKNCVMYAKNNQPLHKLASSLFHRATDTEPFQATVKKPFYKDLTPYLTGWLAAFASALEQPPRTGKASSIPIAKQLQAYKKFLHRMTTTTEKTTKNSLREQIKKQAPAIVSFAKAVEKMGSVQGAYNCINYVVKAATRSLRIFKPPQNLVPHATSIAIEIYPRDTVYQLLTTFAFNKANTKTDLLEYLRGFKDHYKGSLPDIFSPLGLKILQSSKQPLKKNFLNDRYSSKNIQSLLTHTYTDATDNDRWYASSCSASTLDEDVKGCSLNIPNLGNPGDCMESTLLANIAALMRTFCSGNFQVLPPTAQNNPKIKLFFDTIIKKGLNNKEAREEWFYLFSDKKQRKNKAQFNYTNPEFFCELEPSIDNFIKGLAFFFEIKATNLKNLGEKLSDLINLTVSFTSDNAIIPTITMEIKSPNGMVFEQIDSIIETGRHAQAQRKTKQAFSSSLTGEIKDPLLKELILTPNENIRYQPSPYQDLMGKEFFVLCRLFDAGTKEFKAPNLTQHTTLYYAWKAWQEGWETEQLKPEWNELPKDVLSLFAENPSKGPFKSYCETISAHEILRQIIELKDNIKSLSFLKNVDANWLRANAENITAALFNKNFLSEEEGKTFIKYAKEIGILNTLITKGYEHLENAVLYRVTEVSKEYSEHHPYFRALFKTHPLIFVLEKVVKGKLSATHLPSSMLRECIKEKLNFMEFLKNNQSAIATLEIGSRATLATWLKKEFLGIINGNPEYASLLKQVPDCCPWILENDVKSHSSQFSFDINFDTLLLTQKTGYLFGPSHKARHSAYFYLVHRLTHLDVLEAQDYEFDAIIKKLGNTPLEDSKTFADLFIQLFSQLGGMKKLAYNEQDLILEEKFELLEHCINLVNRYKQAAYLKKIVNTLDATTFFTAGISLIPSLNPNRNLLSTAGIGTSLASLAISLYWPLLQKNSDITQRVGSSSLPLGIACYQLIKPLIK